MRFFLAVLINIVPEKKFKEFYVTNIQFYKIWNQRKYDKLKTDYLYTQNYFSKEKMYAFFQNCICMHWNRKLYYLYNKLNCKFKLIIYEYFYL